MLRFASQLARAGWYHPAFTLLLLCALPAYAGEVTIEAAGELLAGERSSSGYVFRGIPFAAPPVGDLRWRAPLPPSPRQGVQDARKFGAACMQTRYITEWYEDVIKTFGGDPAVAAAPAEISEDCLYLNIWTPQLKRAAKLPVMVYIHGGNNLGGWSYEPNYLGEKLASQGVVVVSIAYRLGVFGFFAHPELTAESGTGSSGNYAILDQIAALTWIQDNIASFGGNSGNVTVFGESSGAQNISYLLQSPLAAGLFNRAIRQSGSFDLNYRDSLASEETFGLEFATSLQALSIHSLRALPARTVLDGAESYYVAADDEERSLFYGIKEGYVLPDHAANLYRNGQIAPGNLLIGVNADEKLMYTPAETTPLDVEIFAKQYFLESAQADVFALLAGLPSPRAQLAVLRAAQEQQCTALMQAQQVSNHQLGEVYFYQFSRLRPGPGGSSIGAYHGAELPYVFNTHDDWLAADDVDAALTNAMVSYWVNFARSGNPNGPGLVTWPRFTKGTRQVLWLDENIRSAAAPYQQLCQLLKSVTP